MWGKARISASGLSYWGIVSAALLALSLFFAPAAHANSKYAAIVIDGYTGKVVFSRNADNARYPASLTKIMTLYMVFEELEAGRLSLDTRMKVSRRAQGQAPSKLGLKAGQYIRVDDAIKALVTKSANDVATVVAEHIGGTESAFARKMTAKARELGMRRTRFMNASGLPNTRQKTTARDMAKLGQRIREDFPEYYTYFSTERFSWHGRNYSNHNNLLGKYGGTVGIKTGYTRASGFNLTAAVERDGKYLIGVVMGGRKARTRDNHMVEILDDAWDRVRPGNPSTLMVKAPLPIEKPPVTFAANLPDTSDPALMASLDLGSTSGRGAQFTNTEFLPLEPPAEEELPLRRASLSEPAVPSATPSQVESPAARLAKAALREAAEPLEKVGNLIAPPAHAHGGNTGATGSTRNVALPPPPKKQPSLVGSLFPPESWVIQIGAYRDPAQAVDRIREAMQAAPGELSNAVPVTVPVMTGDTTLYRSRFGGFDELTARNACGQLARVNISCIALPPSGWSAASARRAPNNG
ncbi:serine hydrolase [Tepidicaulis sp.]|uniref:serine hydrolase n=1 Tax=Tepidicaulis sp. TaxID=1920809 RepID=UPI003B5C79AA